MPSISDTAKQRLANIKKTGGIPPKRPQGSTLGQDAKNIKVRQQAEEIPEANIQRGKGRIY